MLSNNNGDNLHYDRYILHHEIRGGPGMILQLYYFKTFIVVNKGETN